MHRETLLWAVAARWLKTGWRKVQRQPKKMLNSKRAGQGSGEKTQKVAL